MRPTLDMNTTGKGLWNRIDRTYLFLAFGQFFLFSYSENFCAKVKQESVILKLNSVYADRIAKNFLCNSKGF